MTITQSSTRLVAVAAGVAVAFALLLGASMPTRAAALSQTQIQSILNLLTSFGADQATINNVSAALNGQATTGTTGGTGTVSGGVCPFTWSRSLTVGASGADVKALQQFLNMDASTMVAATGAGSPSKETTYFGPATKAAVAKFQAKYGITPVAGYFGPLTRAKANSLCTTGTTGGTTGGNTGTVTGTGLKVMVAPTSPNNSVLVQGQAIGDLGEYTFSNPSSAPITVTGLTFNRTGVSNDQTVDNVYLYNGVNRLTDSAGVSNGVFSFTNSAGIFTVPAGGSMTVAVRADIDKTNTSGQQIGVSLTNVAASGSLDSSVAFPIMSGYQTISSASMATVDYGGTTIPTGTPSISPQPAYTVWQNTISVGTNPVTLKTMRFTNLGSIDATALTNLRLYVDGTQVGSAVPQMGADRTVTFDLSASPVSLATQSHVIKLVADVVGGASRTIEMSVQRASDAMFVDSQLNQPVLATNNGSAFSAVTAGTITVNSVSGSSGVSVTKDPSSPVNDVAVGASSVTWASYDLLASGEPVKVNDLYVFASSTTSGGALAGVGGLNNGKIMVTMPGASAPVQVGSTKDIGSLTANATDFSLGSSLILPAGQVVRVDIVGDAKDTAGTNLPAASTVVVTLKAGTSNAQGQSSLQSANVPASDTNGNTINVSSSALTVTKYSGYSAQTLIAGTTGAKIGAFTLSAGATEGLNVNTIGVDLSATTGITNLVLKDDSTGTTLGTVITSPSASNSISVNLPIAASQTKTVDVYADLLSNAVTTTATVNHTNTTATGQATGISASPTGDVALQTITVGTGQLFGNNGANNPVAKNVVAGASSLQVGNYRFSSSNSPYTVQKLLVKIPNGAASAVSNVTVSYTDKNGATQTATQALANPSTSQPYATATFTGLSFYVPLNSSADLNVSVSTPTVTSSTGISGAQVQAYIDHVNGFQALDASGNATTTSFASSDLDSNTTSGYGLLVLRKSVASFAGMNYQSNSQPNSGTDLYRFTISADQAGPVEIYKLSIKTATSTMTVTNWNLYDAANPGTALTSSAQNVSDTSGDVSFTPTNVIQIPAGGSKTFYVRASNFTGWASGASLSVNLATADSSILANTTASSAASGNNYVWSDLSATNHSTSSSDWTNGYLLKNLVDGTYSFSY